MKPKSLYWQIPFLLLLIVGTVVIIKQQNDQPFQHNEGKVFGTFYHITYQSQHDLHREILAELEKVDASLSMFNQQSTLSRVNRNENVELDDYFVEVVSLAQQVSAETNGAFDITVAPLVNAWGFGFKQGTPPTRHVIDSMRPFIGYQKISLSKHPARLTKQDPRTMLDCSAIAKGYGCDVVARLLKQHDVTNFMVEIGGEVVTNGVNANRTAWRIGVTKPTDDSLSVNGELQTVLNITDRAMATSGNYRKFYYKNGRKYAHTINPTSGYPVQHNILSATVLAPSCATADAYATAFMVLGLEGAQKILARHSELMVYLIYTDKQGRNAVWFSPSLKKYIQEK